MKSRRRTQRIASVIHEEIARLLIHEVSDPALSQINIAEVDVTGDLRQARIYYTAPESVSLKEIEKGLKRANSFLRKRLGEALSLRVVPELQFFFDTHSLQVAHLYTVLDGLPKPGVNVPAPTGGVA